MSHVSTRLHAAALALAFAVVPSSAAFAQHHGGHRGGMGAQNQAGTTPKAPQTARPANPQHTQATQASTANRAQANFSTGRQRASDASLVSSLHSARTQLAQADHDYGGHRGRAMREIEEAMRLLGHRGGQAGAGAVAASRPGITGTANRTNASTAGTRNGTTTTSHRTGTTTTGASSTAGQPMTQAASDSQLRSARQSLSSLESRMDSSGMNASNYVRAKDKVQSALRELNLALSDR